MAAHRKHWLLLSLAVVLVLIASIPLLHYHRQKAVMDYIAAIPGDLKAEGVEAGLFGNNVIVHRLSGTVQFFEQAPFTISIERLSIEGLNKDALESAGVVTIADRVSMRNFQFDFEGSSPAYLGYASISMRSYDVRDIRMNWKSLQRAGKDGLGSPFFSDFLTSILFGRTLILESRVQTAGIPQIGKYSQENSIMTIKRMEAESFSLLHHGKTINEDIAIHYENGIALTAKKVDFDSYDRPDSSLTLQLSGSAKNLDVVDSMKILEEGYSLRGLIGKEIRISSADGEQADIPILEFDADIGNGKLLLKLQTEEVYVSGGMAEKLLSGIGSGMQPFTDRSLRFFAFFALGTERTDDGNIRIVYEQELSEDRLGRMDCNFELIGKALSGPRQVLPVDTSTIAFVKGGLTLEDKTFLRRLFESSVFPSEKPEDNGTGVKKREVLVRDIRRDAETLPASLKDAVVKFADFLEKSGRYRLRVQADSPVGLMGIFGNETIPEQLVFHADHDAEESVR